MLLNFDLPSHENSLYTQRLQLHNFSHSKISLKLQLKRFLFLFQHMVQRSYLYNNNVITYTCDTRLQGRHVNNNSYTKLESHLDSLTKQSKFRRC